MNTENNIIPWFENPLIKKSEVARKLYNLPEKCELKALKNATTKFHNKVSGTGGARLRETEIERLNEIKIEFIESLLA